MSRFTIPFSNLTMSNLSEVGGKNASLGEMIKNLSPLAIQVPEGYAITVEAFDEFLKYNKIYDALEKALAGLDRLELTNLSSVAQDCRKLIDTGELPPKVKEAITKTHDRLVLRHGLNPSFAVRSSATAEDSPTTSFAGQHDSFLNVRGIEQVLRAVKQCYASLYNDRAIKYRNDNNFADMQVRLSVGVQIMVRSDRGSAGVAFTIEPENGNENLIYITGAWGLGESVVQGAVNTDEFYVFKPALKAGKNGIIYKQIGSKQSMVVYGDGSKDRNTAWRETTPSLRDQFVLTDAEVSKIALWCLEIEKHYGMPYERFQVEMSFIRKLSS